MELEDIIRSFLRDVPDFPKPGIMFRDITPLLAQPKVRMMVVNTIANHFKDARLDAVAAIEARGFIFGSLIAQELGIPFIPVRKSGRLPFHKITEEYQLEYGSAIIEMHQDAVKPGWRILLHDDLLATGGTASAAARMIRKLEGDVVGFSFIINLAFLQGEKSLCDGFDLKPHYLVNYL